MTTPEAQSKNIIRQLKYSLPLIPPAIGILCWGSQDPAITYRLAAASNMVADLSQHKELFCTNPCVAGLGLIVGGILFLAANKALKTRK